MPCLEQTDPALIGAAEWAGIREIVSNKEIASATFFTSQE